MAKHRRAVAKPDTLTYDFFRNKQDSFWGGFCEILPLMYRRNDHWLFYKTITGVQVASGRCAILFMNINPSIFYNYATMEDCRIVLELTGMARQSSR